MLSPQRVICFSFFNITLKGYRKPVTSNYFWIQILSHIETVKKNKPSDFLLQPFVFCNTSSESIAPSDRFQLESIAMKMIANSPENAQSV
ncbi:MAG: hypothetical protein WAS55_12270 [Saprospiraceae bacterium]